MKTHKEINAANLAVVQLKNLEFMRANMVLNSWLLAQEEQAKKDVERVNKKGFENFRKGQKIEFMFSSILVLVSGLLLSLFISFIWRGMYADAAFLSGFLVGTLFCTYTVIKITFSEKFTPIEPWFKLVHS
jgi:hypothetical protein